MISWIWDYANNLEAVRRKSKCLVLHVLTCRVFANALAASKLPAKANGQRRRVEKPLLHQVLHPAKLKAQHGRLAKPKGPAVAPDNTESEMHDVDASSTTTDTAKPCVDTRLAIQTMGISDDHGTSDATAADIGFETLDMVDHNS